MRCPFCGNEETQVKDSRPAEENSAIRRRRACPDCCARFTTYERVQIRELTVVKNNGDKQLFNREKLIRSMKVALQKRPIEVGHIERIANSIIRQLETSGEQEITTTEIGEKTMHALANLDKVAYIRYASVYKDFCEAEDFNEFLGDLTKLQDKEK